MPNPQQVGAFVPTTNIWDIQSLLSDDVSNEALRELLVRLYQNINNIALVLNIKDSGYYDTQEFVNGQLFFPNPDISVVSPTNIRYRQIYRKVINFGALPNAGTKSVAHGIVITGKTTFTRIYATASDTTGLNYIPIPYASPTLINNIELKLDNTNVTIITGSNRSNFDTCYVVLEYLQF